MAPLVLPNQSKKKKFNTFLNSFSIIEKGGYTITIDGKFG